MVSSLPLLLASVGLPTACHGFLTGKRPLAPLPVPRGYPPTRRLDPIQDSSSLVSLPQKFSQVARSISEVSQAIDDLNPSTTDSETMNKFIRLESVLVLPRQFQVWSTLVDLPMETSSFHFLDVRPLNEVGPEPTIYFEEICEYSFFSFARQLTDHCSTSTCSSWASFSHPPLSHLPPTFDRLFTYLADWNYLLSLRTNRARVIIYGLPKIYVEGQQSDHLTYLKMVCASAVSSLCSLCGLFLFQLTRVLLSIVVELIYHTLRVVFLVVAHTRRLRHPFFVLFVLSLFRLASATGSQDDTSGPRCQTFDGVNLSFMPWFIAFSAWIAWKKPELIALVSGSSPRPAPANPGQPTASESKRIADWDLLNVQLYGALVSFLSSPLQAALYVDAPNSGVDGLKYLRSRYGAQSTGDRAEATQRLQRSYIDARAKLSEADVTHQYNEMQIASADIVSAGGQRPDDQLLISMFENSLPPAYSHIRQMVRYKGHNTFTDFYNDLLTQVKAEVRSSASMQYGAFQAHLQPPGSGKGKGKGAGGRGGYGVGRGGKAPFNGSNPCFTCLGTDHTRDKCPHPPTTCAHCGGSHMSVLCPKGEGGPARDALTENAKKAILRQVEYAASRRKGPTALQATSTSERGEITRKLAEDVAAYLAQKFRTPKSSSGDPATSSQSPAASAGQPTALVATDNSSEMDDFFASLTVRPRAEMALHCPPSPLSDSSAVAAADDDMRALPAINFLSAVALIDSQATHFVLPSRSYLLRVTDENPQGSVDTANGATKPDCAGIAGLHLLDDNGKWHYFEVFAIVLHACPRVLYSLRAMSQCGVRHFLESGYILLPGDRCMQIHQASYSIEVSFGPPVSNAYASRTSLSPLSTNSALEQSRGRSSVRDRGSDSRAVAPVPQSLLWSRLGFPNEHIWRRVADVLSDHGLPDSSHLRYDFPISDAVAQARSRALPFHSARDPDQLPAPGSLVYLDFAGPMVESFPHKFRFYCGAVDAGSGYARLLACHGPTKEVASACLAALLSDLRSHMDLSHRLLPHVVVTDQGSAFMSYYFRDFLAADQVRHWPSSVYTPQQNAYVERMWGTRFAMARSLMAYAGVGPALHPYALQTANWICNRLPYSTRSWKSPYYLLARRPASVAYLRSFGCLVRVFLPPAQRAGDRHFSERGQLGVYLGPSEQSPAAVVYLPSRRQLLVTRHVIFYEDLHPGIKHVDSGWRALDQEGGRRLTVSHGALNDNMPLSLIDAVRDSSPPTDCSPNTLQAPHSEHSSPPHAESNIEGPLAHQNLASPPPSITSLPRGDPADPADPSSRAFIRNLPRRSTRYQGAYYTDPASSSRQQAVRNAQLQNWWQCGSPELHACFVYLTSISGTISDAYVVTSTSDMGDIRIPRGYRQAMESPESQYWKEAVDRELKGLIENKTWDVVPMSSVPPGANIMRCHMVFTVKRLSDGSIEKFKCRLVADGNTQRYGVDFNRIFSTVAKLSTLRLLLAIAAARGYRLTSIDVRQAYLHAELREDLYMQMPPGLPTVDSDGNKLVAKLRKSLYGLRQAGREWADLLSSFLTSWGFRRSAIDICLYLYTSGGHLLYIVVWVDDCVIVDNHAPLREAFVKDLGSRFPVEDKGDLEWILQVRVTRDWDERTLSLSQELYVADLLRRYSHFINDESRRFDCPCDATVTLSPEQCPTPGSLEHEEMACYREAYMSLVGAYLWLANMTRFELGYVAAQLARFVSNPSRVHFKAAIRVLVYLRTTKARALVLTPLRDSPPNLRVFVDSSWGTRFSVSGAVFEFMGAIVHWFSKTQRSVSMSSTEAEYFAASLAARDTLFLRDLLEDLNLVQNYPTPMRSDNKGVAELSFDPVAFKKTKHILRAAEFLRDLVARRKVDISWLSGADNVADLLTKLVTVGVFRHLFSLASRVHDVP